MTSFRQIEANRRNALKSTGPNTEAGKHRSRRNAVRHGLVLKRSSDSLNLSRTTEHSKPPSSPTMKRRLRSSVNWCSGWHHCYGAYVGLRRLKLSYLHSTLKSFARASILGSKKQHDFQYSEQDVRLSKAKQTWPMITTMDLLRIAITYSSLAIRQSTLLELWRTASSVLRTSTMVRSIGLVAYESRLWRQFVQTLLCLRSARIC